MWAVLYLWAGTWTPAVQRHTGTYDCLIPQLQDQVTLTLNTTDASVLSQDLPVLFSAPLANLWPTVFMHLDGGVELA